MKLAFPSWRHAAFPHQYAAQFTKSPSPDIGYFMTAQPQVLTTPRPKRQAGLLPALHKLTCVIFLFIGVPAAAMDLRCSQLHRNSDPNILAEIKKERALFFMGHKETVQASGTKPRDDSVPGASPYLLVARFEDRVGCYARAESTHEKEYPPKARVYYTISAAHSLLDNLAANDLDIEIDITSDGQYLVSEGPISVRRMQAASKYYASKGGKPIYAMRLWHLENYPVYDLRKDFEHQWRSIDADTLNFGHNAPTVQLQVKVVPWNRNGVEQTFYDLDLGKLGLNKNSLSIMLNADGHPSSPIVNSGDIAATAIKLGSCKAPTILVNGETSSLNEWKVDLSSLSPVGRFWPGKQAGDGTPFTVSLKEDLSDESQKNCRKALLDRNHFRLKFEVPNDALRSNYVRVRSSSSQVDIAIVREGRQDSLLSEYSSGVQMSRNDPSATFVAVPYWLSASPKAGTYTIPVSVTVTYD